MTEQSRPTELLMEEFKASFGEVSPKLRAFFDRPDDDLSDEDSWLVGSITGDLPDGFWMLHPFGPARFNNYVLFVTTQEKTGFKLVGYAIRVRTPNPELHKIPTVNVMKVPFIKEASDSELSIVEPLESKDAELLVSVANQLEPKIAEIEAKIASHQNPD